MSNLLLITFLTTTVCIAFNGCNSSENAPIESDTTNEEILAGGDGTVNDESTNAFSLPFRTISAERKTDFFVGNSLFNQNWVEAPASTSLRDGVGPLFNSRSCSGCHFKDGRGTAPSPNAEMLSMLLRLSIPGQNADGSPIAEPNYGGQLQNFAISGVQPEGKPHISHTIVNGTYPDGEVYSLRKPNYTINNLAYGNLHNSVLISPRVAPQMIGLGLLEAIPESEILKNADEFDANNDGISGRPNYVYNYENKSVSLGRFGWKANQPNLRQQVAGALNGDMGITSSIFPNIELTPSQNNLTKLPNGGTPEIENKEFNQMVYYSSILAVPSFRSQNQTTTGKKLFTSIGCVQCHRASYTTGNYSPEPALSQQKIHPYTDMLLHDMGNDLADNRPDFRANGNEWRTPPLWGIGLFKIVNGHTNYLHDGRARSLEEAILWHGGEAEKTRELFKKLDKKERFELLKFLESL